MEPSDGVVEDFFGYSIDISGDTYVVGAYGHNVDSRIVDSGAVYVFRKGNLLILPKFNC